MASKNSFNFTQATPAVTWSVTHNLGCKPVSDVVIGGDKALPFDVKYIDENSLQIIFDTATTGTARLVGVYHEAMLPGGGIDWPTVASNPPQNPNFVEDFSAGLAHFTLTSGVGSTFSTSTGTYGAQMDVATHNTGTAAVLDEALSAGFVMSSIQFKVRVNELQADDGAFLQLVNDAGGAFLSFTPCREAAFSGSRQPYVFYRASVFDSFTTTPLSTPLTVGTWYVVDIVQDGTDARLTVTDLGTSSVISNTVIGAWTAYTVAHLKFINDSGGQTSPVSYTDVVITKAA